MAEVLPEIVRMMRQIFNSPDLNVTRESSAKTIAGWDSLNHVTLIMEVETHFGLQFKPHEIAGLKNVGELIDLIERRKKSHGG